MDCKYCGESWEYYYVQHEMTEEERRIFLSGEGCPNCWKLNLENMLWVRAGWPLVKHVQVFLRLPDEE